ncbi:MAG: Lsr2 family DNA-binding protein [Acidimicrobiales bacterium]
MAKHQLVSYSYTCDVCGGTIPESGADGASRMLNWDGSDYVLDVCQSHGSQLGDLIAQLQGFVDASRRDAPRPGRRRRPTAVAAPTATTRPARTARPARSARPTPSAPAAAIVPAAPVAAPALAAPATADVAAIRAWARENGYVVNERGRIPGPVMAAYQAIRGGAPAPQTFSAGSARRGRGRKAAKA